MNNNQLWQNVLGELELTISKANFTTWFKGTHIISKEENKIIIGVPNTFTKAWLEKKFRKNIHDIIAKIDDSIRDLEFKVAQKKQDNQGNAPVAPKVDAVAAPTETTQNHKPKPQTETVVSPNKISYQDLVKPVAQHLPTIKAFSLNTKYNFDNFIVGKCNELAHAAAKAVANKPGESYNPLFIYGGVGLGKTHLLQAIGNKVQENNPQARILYVSCEKFTSDFIKAIQTRKIDQFKRTYRTVDLLLMDDVQFLAAKESTQEEFFHTFNELHQNNRQLVVTSDRPPKAIPELESRLLSRFEWGMIADVSPIDYETRVAILETKCQEKGLVLGKDIIEYIARAIHNNVREMEGALNRIKAHIELQNLTADMPTVKNILATLSNLPRTDALSAPMIIKIVSEFFDVTKDDLLGKSREKRLVYPRQITMFLLREELQSSYPAIGKELGGRDHTTAMHACQKISKDLEIDEKVRQDFNLIKQKLFS